MLEFTISATAIAARIGYAWRSIACGKDIEFITGFAKGPLSYHFACSSDFTREFWGSSLLATIAKNDYLAADLAWFEALPRLTYRHEFRHCFLLSLLIFHGHFCGWLFSSIFQSLIQVKDTSRIMVVAITAKSHMIHIIFSTMNCGVLAATTVRLYYNATTTVHNMPLQHVARYGVLII